ncbi:RtcB family protein [Desulfobacterales bacterium HSG2]|nr:RtcB family protein [Desulfobacterales bacterium HSG2]
MVTVISSEKLPVKLWLDDMPDGALEQAKHLANLPFAFKHVAIMPDSHQGYGMPIGGVLATQGVIIPNAVGVDIGCGMCALRTHLQEIERKSLRAITDRIGELVPVGFEWHDEPKSHDVMPARKPEAHMPVVYQQYEKARHQIGTLGGGNHFIEIQKGSDGYVWIMVHSGSRNIGAKIADHYNKVAARLNRQWFSQIPEKWQLAFLPIDTKEAKQYRSEMEYCVEFALANREVMIGNVRGAFHDVLGIGSDDYDALINIAHNYAAMESHYKHNVMVHRKGATQAREGQIGIIPGSQGTKSYIVRGKGNRESFMSCSHGAGRKMGRKQAVRELSLEREKRLLDSQGIIHAVSEAKDLDEAPGAYKDIDVVMDNQKDLVDILVELSPLAVIKG